MTELNLDAVYQAAIDAIDTPQMGYQITKGYVDPLTLRAIVRAVVPVIRLAAFREFVVDIVRPLGPNGHHPPEDCPCCTIGLKAADKAKQRLLNEVLNG